MPDTTAKAIPPIGRIEPGTESRWCQSPDCRRQEANARNTRRTIRAAAVMVTLTTGLVFCSIWAMIDMHTKGQIALLRQTQDVRVQTKQNEERLGRIQDRVYRVDTQITWTGNDVALVRDLVEEMARVLATPESRRDADDLRRLRQLLTVVNAHESSWSHDRKVKRRQTGDIKMASVDFYQDESDKKEWRWRVTATNGEIIGASSEGYGHRQNAENNLSSLPRYARDVDIKIAADAPDPRPEGAHIPLEFYKDEGNEWRWRITAANGQVVHASSEGFSDKGSARSNVETLVSAVNKWAP